MAFLGHDAVGQCQVMKSMEQLEREVVNEKAGILALNKKGLKRMVDYNLVK